MDDDALIYQSTYPGSPPPPQWLGKLGSEPPTALWDGGD